MSAPNSAVVIARMLSTEGFTDHVAALVHRYSLRNATPGQLRRYKSIKKAFSEMVKAKLDERDRLVLGKMMGVLTRTSFDTGLKIGMTAFVQECRTNGKDAPPCPQAK